MIARDPLPADLVERLAQALARVLVADYQRRHPVERTEPSSYVRSAIRAQAARDLADVERPAS
jgi:hypothetical protein